MNLSQSLILEFFNIIWKDCFLIEKVEFCILRKLQDSWKIRRPFQYNILLDKGKVRVRRIDGCSISNRFIYSVNNNGFTILFWGKPIDEVF